MSIDRATQAALSFTKPLFQHRAVHVIAPRASADAIAAYAKAHGARSVQAGERVSSLPARSVEVFFAVLSEEWPEDTWTALQAARAEAGVVIVHASGDALRWTQALAKRFASVERAELVRGDAAWVGPSGAVTATVSVEDSAPAGAVFVCAERPQRLALGSVCIGQGAAQAATAASAPHAELSLSGDIAESLEADRVRELETRLAQTMEDLLQAQLVAAQALAERDTLKRKLELAKGGATVGGEDPGALVALRDELDAIETLIRGLNGGAQAARS